MATARLLSKLTRVAKTSALHKPLGYTALATGFFVTGIMLNEKSKLKAREAEKLSLNVAKIKSLKKQWDQENKEGFVNCYLQSN